MQIQKKLSESIKAYNLNGSIDFLSVLVMIVLVLGGFS
jgi:hypothetical protein